jgi:hypothetical protein
VGVAFLRLIVAARPTTPSKVNKSASFWVFFVQFCVFFVQIHLKNRVVFPKTVSLQKLGKTAHDWSASVSSANPI